MTPTLLVASCRLRIPADDFRAHAQTAAARIALSPGLAWKVWGLDDEIGFGTSAYLFHARRPSSTPH